jgi:hypothetical protein
MPLRNLDPPLCARFGDIASTDCLSGESLRFRYGRGARPPKTSRTGIPEKREFPERMQGRADHAKPNENFYF